MSDRPQTHLFGRESEMEVIYSLLAGVYKGESHGLIIGAEAGMGKTALCDSAVEEAGNLGILVLAGHCLPTSTIPYQPFDDMLRQFQTSGPFAQDISLLNQSKGTDRYALALLDLISSLSSGRPVLLVVEDLHWADSATLAILPFLCRNLASKQVGVILSYRSDDVREMHEENKTTMLTALASLTKDAHLLEMPLSGLSYEAMRNLVSSKLGGIVGADVTTALRARSGEIHCSHQRSSNGLWPPVT